MRIKDIYKRFYIPINLQEHMFRVFSVVNFIENNWIGEKIDWNKTKKMALLHDLGNIVKFDIQNHPEFLGNDQKNLNYWKNIKNKMTNKYGADDHEATKKILKELKIDKEIIKTIFSKRFSNSISTLNSNNLSLKVFYYADLRTLPFRIGTLEERIEDIKSRMPKYTSRNDFKELINACLKIEEQIQKNMNIPVKDINDNIFKFFKKEYLSFNI